MAKKLKWGVIGSGGIARRRTIPEGIIQSDIAELAGVYDINASINRDVAGEFDTTAFASIDELVNSDIDAVYIATPVKLHHEQALACAKAGKHVLCEKPLGMTVGETEEMIAAFHDAGVLLGIAFMMRFNTQHQAALGMVREGRLGQLVYGRAQLSCWYPPLENAWRQDQAAGGGGSLIDMGGHCIDLLEMFFGKTQSVSCFISNSVHKYQSEDSAVAALFFECGALATVDTFFCIPDASSRNVLEIYGSKGSILAEGTIGQGEVGNMVAYLEKEQGGYDAQQSRQADEGLKIAPEPTNTYLGEITEFSRAILDGREPLINAEVGLRNQKVLEACYASAKTGKVTAIE